MEHKVNLVLPLAVGRRHACGDGSTAASATRSGRRNDAGLSIDVGGREQLDAFYGVFAARMRELGSPGARAPFFAAIFDAFGELARASSSCSKGETPIGGLMALAVETPRVPWAACASEIRALCPNMLLYWETLRAACADGFRRFDFGRSTRDSGTYRFKRQWGAEEEPLFWYTIPIGRRVSLPTGKGGRTATRLVGLWRHLPLSFTQRVGPHVRKYLVQ